MKIVIVDNLTETFKGEIVQSGLQKSSKLDARAFSAMGYDTTYIYCGHIKDTYNYKHVVANKMGSKDRAIKETGKQKVSSHHLKKYLKSVRHVLQSADCIIAHCHSTGMLKGVNDLVQDKKIIYVYHDVIDLKWGLSGSCAVKDIRESGRNYVYVATNSNYSMRRLDAISDRAHDIYGSNGHLDQSKVGMLPYRGDEYFDGYIDHFVWTDQKPTSEEILNVEQKSAVIGRYSTKKQHHKLYKYNNPNNTIVHYGIKDERNDPNLNYYNRLIKQSNDYKENLNDDELWNAIKSSQSIILPCHHEGFGYTAFEAGIYGVVPVILTRKLKYLKDNDEHIHATVEYLNRAGVKHYSADFDDQEQIYKTIDESINITKEERLEISKKLLDYFSLENYVQDRLDIFEKAKKNEVKNKLEMFYV
jgi:hypothetical protein